jgi:hypothetical protein
MPQTSFMLTHELVRYCTGTASVCYEGAETCVHSLTFYFLTCLKRLAQEMVAKRMMQQLHNSSACDPACPSAGLKQLVVMLPRIAQGLLITDLFGWKCVVTLTVRAHWGPQFSFTMC